MKTEPTEALKEIKHCTWTAEDFNINDGLESYEVIDEDDAINIANIAFREGQSSPKIKQLEWIGSEGGNVLTGIAIYAGYYRITSTSEGAWMRIATAGIRKRFDTVDEAKAAAQADFEKRVKECLDL